MLSWTSDIWLALFLPLAIALVAWRLFFLPNSWTEILDLLSLKSLDPNDSPPFSAVRARNAFARYRQLSALDASHLHASYSSISRAHKRIGYDLGYPAKLTRLAKATDANGRVTDSIARLAEGDFQLDLPPRGGTSSDLMRVKEALKHFIRNWSADGLSERTKIFTPILEVLKRDEKCAEKRVLVPGAGLGRLAWDISQLGFLETSANELSYFMILAFRFLLSPSTTSQINQHTIHPYAQWFSHQRTTDSLFRAMSFPDAIPRLSRRFKLVEQDFLTLRETDGYDYIVTLFFIDTSLNILTTLEQIHRLLRPGGTWLNLGPLLWTSGGQAKLELSLEEMVQAAEHVGFVFEPREDGLKTRTVECEYTADSRAMMRWLYQAEFWVARKSS
ncbi:N2227 domain-containing protein [Mycena indigotica]|uniref:N2227 domain-containing protein n=1 Tax=Mycena indigotica TaxID=2126181 RepID=A0A8H6W0K7_9AGAR|nr:N2227 domain-containing protein [Mycena indigotica]KAF7301079.1 N2227 domain-containing protein [Mycena indigotica]